MKSSKISIALAGTALLVSVLFATPLGQAASRLVVPKNSVGAPQLKRNAVGTKKIAKNAITSLKVKNGSLLASDFKAGQLPAGPKGDTGQQGPKGAAGAPGISGYQIVVGPPTTVAPGASGVALATCPAGKKALGGGGGRGAGWKFSVADSEPSNFPAGWMVSAWNNDNSSADLSAFAICANVS